MLIAVLADPHSNHAAFDAVLHCVREHAPDLTILLGDLVGYNASPNECVALAREHCDVVVKGNHDHDIIASDSRAGTNNAARLAQDWTRDALDGDARQYLGSLPKRWSGDGLTAVHGCYLNDTHYTGYVTTTMLERNLEVVADEAHGSVAFCGHTHVPMIGWTVRGQCAEPRIEGPIEWPAGAQAVLINPGAVGQPRDRDPRAAFALVDTGKRRMELVRVEYDIGHTIEMLRLAGLPLDLADRLTEGR